MIIFKQFHNIQPVLLEIKRVPAIIYQDPETLWNQLPLQQLSHVFIIQSTINLKLPKIAYMGLLILSKCDSHNNSWLLQFQYKKLKIKKVKAFAEENKQTDKQMIKLKLTAVVYNVIYNSLNSFNRNSDQHLISLYLITAKLFIKTMGIKKMITTLQLLNILFLSIPNKRYREE